MAVAGELGGMIAGAVSLFLLLRFFGLLVRGRLSLRRLREERFWP